MKLLKVLLVLYLLACIVLYFMQEKVIFAAHPYPNSTSYPIGKEIEIPLSETLTMNTLLLPAVRGKKSEKVILYLHGNKGNIKRGIYQTRVMKNKGCDIMIIDYRSYGKTEGKPVNDRQMLRDANLAYQYLKKSYEEKNIYILGYSLGTGMASYIAAQNKPGHLILVAPFTSLTDIKDKFLWMFPDFLLKYKLDNSKHLSDVSCPVTILHGTDDEVVDYEFSQKLKETFPQVKLITSKGQGHRGIIFDPLVSREIEIISR